MYIDCSIFYRGRRRWIYNYLCNQCQSLTTYFVSSNLDQGEVNNIMWWSDLRQVGGFLRVLRFPSPIKLTATI